MTPVDTYPPCFMLIDDDPLCNALSSFQLGRMAAAHEISTFLSALEALDHIRSCYCTPGSFRHTVLLLDINMPELNGWDFMECFETLPARIREQFTIYMLSSSCSHDDIEKSLYHPFIEGYLLKPMSSDTARRLVDDLYAPGIHREMQGALV